MLTFMASWFRTRAPRPALGKGQGVLGPASSRSPWNGVGCAPGASLHGPGRPCWRPPPNTCRPPASSFPAGQLSTTPVEKGHFMESSGVGSKSSLADTLLCLSRKHTVCIRHIKMILCNIHARLRIQHQQSPRTQHPRDSHHRPVPPTSAIPCLAPKANVSLNSVLIFVLTLTITHFSS